MSAQHIYDTAPLGALVRFSNGEPRPPARFTRKVEAWEHRNGTGRLVSKAPGAGRSPESFTLHLGDFGMQGSIILVLHRTYEVTSPLSFEVAEMPPEGAARVLTSWQGIDELRHLAANHAAAEAWLSAHHWADARIDIVSAAEGVPAAPAIGRAA
jgi:hypothetical protein